MKPGFPRSWPSQSGAWTASGFQAGGLGPGHPTGDGAPVWCWKLESLFRELRVRLRLDCEALCSLGRGLTAGECGPEMWGARRFTALPHAARNGPPRGQPVGRASVPGAPAGHPGASRQAGDGSDPQGTAAGLSRCLSRVPALPHSAADRCVPSADCVPGFGVAGPSGLGSRARLEAVPESHFPWEPGQPGVETRSLRPLRSPGLCGVAELGPGSGGGPQAACRAWSPLSSA